jgi:hypothetical protein
MEAAADVIVVPLQSGEEVEVSRAELPDDANAVIGMLRKELVPVRLWLEFGVRFAKPPALLATTRRDPPAGALTPPADPDPGLCAVTYGSSRWHSIACTALCPRCVRGAAFEVGCLELARV